MSRSHSFSPLFEPQAKRQRLEHAEAGAQAPQVLIGSLNHNRQPLFRYRPGERFSYEYHEKLDHLPANDPLFVKVERLNKQKVDLILNAIENCNGHDEEISNLYEEVKKKGSVDYGQPITIGIMVILAPENRVSSTTCSSSSCWQPR